MLDAVARSDGRLRALCRVQPKDAGAVAEARRCLEAGADGIKLHPRAEQFTLSEPSVRELVAAAHEHRKVVLIHAGPRDPRARAGHRAAVGRVPRRAADPRPLRDLRPGVAVARAPGAPEPADRHRVVGARRRARHVRAVPARQHRVGERLALRRADRGRHADAAARAAGRASTPSGCRGIMGAQVQRVLDGEELLDLGPAPGAPQRGARPAARARRHPPHDGRWAARSCARTSPSRWRSRGSRARSATTRRRRRCAPPCSSCSTSSTSTWRRPRTAARSRRPRACSCSR